MGSISTAEAELVAATAGFQEIMWLRYLMASIKDYSAEKMNPTVLYCDNQAAIALAANPAFHQRTKHIDVKYKFVRKAAKEGIICVQYCSTKEQLQIFLQRDWQEKDFVC